MSPLSPPPPPAGDFVSEPLEPRSGAFDTAAMARGEPGLPAGFGWRGQWYDIVERLDGWKETSAEGGRAGGEVYLRRHAWRLRMSDGSTWIVYFARQTPRSGSPKRRWFLRSRETPETDDARHSPPPTPSA